MIRFCVVPFLFCVILCLSAFPCYAQSLSLSIWPPLIEVMIQPGRSASTVYKLTNNSDHEVQLVPNIMPFSPHGESGQIKFISPAKPASSFFSFENNFAFGEPFALSVGQTKDLKLKITIPAKTKDSDYYYTFFFTTALLDQSGQTTASAVTQIGSNILLTVSQSGTPRLLGRIVDFSAPLIVDSLSPVNFIVRLENQGQSFWKPFGKIGIQGSLNQNAEIKLLEQNILAGSTRQLFIASWKPQLPIGPFKAKLVFSPNATGQILSSEITLCYLPYKLLIGLFVLFLFLVLLKRLKNHA